MVAQKHQVILQHHLESGESTTTFLTSETCFYRPRKR